MPTTRTRRSRYLKEQLITAEASAAWQARDWLALHQTLGLRPWAASSLDAATATPPEWAGEMWRSSCARARELRRLLQTERQ